eukprot:CAMPEP_0178993516 /NCGR_PEP_ID=MMETSP0795-20121207/6745_1 /TAXON_ID=88552 /ORGANISM="Amoebophrya sp., Strain Ameob2" /LENGTH=462 /DNA_ID=CAMNT_0020685581 /DNA_START=140 /DNA_END=1528 /DNA_ORIENTATION=-
MADLLDADPVFSADEKSSLAHYTRSIQLGYRAADAKRDAAKALLRSRIVGFERSVVQKGGAFSLVAPSVQPSICVGTASTRTGGGLASSPVMPTRTKINGTFFGEGVSASSSRMSMSATMPAFSASTTTTKTTSSSSSLSSSSFCRGSSKSGDLAAALCEATGRRSRSHVSEEVQQQPGKSSDASASELPQDPASAFFRTAPLSPADEDKGATVSLRRPSVRVLTTEDVEATLASGDETEESTTRDENAMVENGYPYSDSVAGEKTKNRVAERAKAFAVWEATEAERLKSEIVAMKAEVEEDELAVATLEAMARDYGLKKEEIRRDTRDRIRKMSEELRKAKRRHERQKEKLAADLSFPAFGAYGEDDVDRIQGGPEVEEVNQRDNFAKMGSSSEDFYADSELGHDYDSQLFRRAGAANADGVPQLESIHRNQRSMTSGSALLENGITCILEEGEDDFDEEF